MSFIIRLQNLPWSANAHDIREFFKGLSIPEGGVHIVGGELGDAFIAFSTDEDARLAMQKTGNALKGIQVTLLLSSRTEMQKVIETARQQAMGIQSFMNPVAPVPPVQPVTPTQLPPVVPQFQAPNIMQTHPQRMPSVDHQPTNLNQNAYPGRPLQPNQHGQPFPQPFNAHQAPFVNQMPFHGQKMSGFPPGVVPPQSGMPPQGGIPPLSGMPPQFYGQPPPPVSVPSNTAMGHHVHNAENTPPQMPPNFSSAGHQASNYSIPPSQIQSQKDVEEDKKDKKLVSSSTTSRDKRDSRDGRDNKGRDERRRRTKSRSRSRSKDRDRRRRHRSRSRSRSRDKGGRRRRSRSRDRDRGRDATRDKERDRQRDRKDRSYRDKSERSSQETSGAEPQPPPQVKVAENSGGIPGLGEIPDDIPREGLSIFTQPSNAPVQTKETPASSGWPKPNVPEPQQFNPPSTPQNLPKPFLLASPPNLNQPGPFSSANPPLIADPNLNKKPPNALPPPFSNQNAGPQGNYKPPLLQDPKDESGPPRDYPPEDRRDWPPHESFDRRKFRDDDRGYRGQNHGRDRNYDSPKPPPHAREGWDNPKDADKDHHPGEWGRPFSRREDDYGYPRDKDGSRNPDQDMPDRRDHHMYATRTFGGGGGGNFPNEYNEYNGEYDDRYGRGGFRGRGRRGFGRDDRMPPDPSRMGGEEHPPYRERYPPDFERGRGGRILIRGRGGRGPPMGDFSRERRPKTCTVELRNVPLNASHGSIKDFFNGLIIPNGGIKFPGGHRGERIGAALIQFGSTRDAFEATKRSGDYLFDSRVMVLYIDDVIFEDARDIGMTSNENNSPEGGTEQMDISSACVYVSGLPIGCTDHDVSRLFEEFKAEDIVLELEKGSRQPSGGCFVRFGSSEEAENALAQIKHPNIDGAPVKLRVCTLESMEAASKEREKIKNKAPPPPPNQEKNNPTEIGTKEHLMSLTQQSKNNERTKKPDSEENADSFNQNGNDNAHKKGADLLTDSVVIKNVSSDITETSIRDFLSDEGLIPEKVYFNRPNSEGKSDVFVVLPKISDAKHATKKNSQLLGSTKVTVELISKPTVMQAMGMPFDPRELFQKGHVEKRPSENSHSDNNNENEDYPVSRSHSPSPHHDHQHRDRDRGYNPRYNRHNEPHQGGGFRPRAPFTYRREHDRYPPERGNYEERVPSGNGSEAGKSSIAPPQDFGKPGCVVALANLPYAATTEDILSFFKDFDNLQPENIIRRYDERNRPTSDSRVSLPSPEEALRAVKSLHRQVMLGRAIYLSLVN